MKKILFLLCFPFSLLAQEVKIIDERDVIPVLVNPKSPKKITYAQGVQYRAVYIALEGIDSTKPAVITISVEQETTPAAVHIEAESANPISRASVDGTTICCIQQGAVLRYTNVTAKSKVRFRYARGNTGTAPLVMKIGTQSFTFNFPSTGGWSTWSEIEFAIQPVSGVLELNSTVLGPVNLDWIKVE